MLQLELIIDILLETNNGVSLDIFACLADDELFDSATFKEDEPLNRKINKP